MAFLGSLEEGHPSIFETRETSSSRLIGWGEDLSAASARSPQEPLPWDESEWALCSEKIFGTGIAVFSE